MVCMNVKVVVTLEKSRNATTSPGYPVQCIGDWIPYLPNGRCYPKARGAVEEEDIPHRRGAPLVGATRHIS